MDDSFAPPVLDTNTTVTAIAVLNFTGADRFSYTISDGRGGTATAEVAGPSQAR